MFQSTRPHGARQYRIKLLKWDVMVSIHAPAWGATNKRNNSNKFRICFNPRARMGRDESKWIEVINSKVSIHAPAWGATSRAESQGLTHMEFQSTRPHGARHKADIYIESDNVVSIHAPAWGATVKFCVTLEALSVSIHAPAWGATNLFLFCADTKAVSIHAPAWGATFFAITFQCSNYVSIHAPAWGATFLTLDKCFKFIVSIHAPAWGATDDKDKDDPIYSSFNPRARMGRDIHQSRFWYRRVVSIHAPAWGATNNRRRCR